MQRKRLLILVFIIVLLLAGVRLCLAGRPGTKSWS